MQVDSLDAPRVELYFPGVHSMQLMAPKEELNFPAAQDSHDVTLEAPDDALNFPAVQSSQLVDPPTSFE